MLTPKAWWNNKKIEERKIWLLQYSLAEKLAELRWHDIDGMTRGHITLLWEPKLDK